MLNCPKVWNGTCSHKSRAPRRSFICAFLLGLPNLSHCKISVVCGSSWLRWSIFLHMKTLFKGKGKRRSLGGTSARGHSCNGQAALPRSGQGPGGSACPGCQENKCDTGLSLQSSLLLTLASACLGLSFEVTQKNWPLDFRTISRHPLSMLVGKFWILHCSFLTDSSQWTLCWVSAEIAQMCPAFTAGVYWSQPKEDIPGESFTFLCLLVCCYYLPLWTSQGS